MSGLTIRVVDESKAPVTTARVVLVPRDASTDYLKQWPHTALKANCTHSSKGNYAPAAKTLAAGEYLLVVSDDTNKKSPVVQRLRLKTQAKRGLRIAIGWTSNAGGKNQNYKALTVSRTRPQRRGQKGGDKKGIRVTLYPRQEAVLVAGYEFIPQKALDFDRYAEGHRNMLARAGKIGTIKVHHQGALMTLMYCGALGKRITYVRASRGEWLKVAETVHPAWPHPLLRKAPVKIGIQHFYAYLHDLGKRAETKGTVVDAGIFSHAYPGGPILYNAWDEGSTTPPYVRKHDPDARRGDWLTKVAKKKRYGLMQSDYTKLADAFCSGATFKVWGCNGWTYYAKLLKTAADNHPKRFEVTTDHSSGRLTERLGPERVRHKVARLFLNGEKNYAAGVWKHLEAKQVRVFAPPAGLTSNPWKRRRTLGGKTSTWHGLGVAKYARFKKIQAYLVKLLGSEAKGDSQGYVDYRAVGKKLSNPALLKLPFATDHYKQMKRIGTVSSSVEWLRLPTGLYLAYAAGTTAKALSKPTANPVGGKAGKLYVVEDCEPSKWASNATMVALFLKASSTKADTGFFVQENGEVHLLKQAGGKWVADTRASLPKKSGTHTFAKPGVVHTVNVSKAPW